MLYAADSTAIFVALIGGMTTVTTGALALLGVWLTTRQQANDAKKDQTISELEKRLDQLESEAGGSE